ncbi:MAG TPA: hypothetical protein VF595_16035, partial [Tepidisphaeraceae bacterium]
MGAQIYNPASVTVPYGLVSWETVAQVNVLAAAVAVIPGIVTLDRPLAIPTIGDVATAVSAKADASAVSMALAAKVNNNDARLADARTPLAHSHPASQISDATAAGRAVLTGATAADQRAALALNNVPNVDPATLYLPLAGGTLGANTTINIGPTLRLYDNMVDREVLIYQRATGTIYSETTIQAAFSGPVTAAASNFRTRVEATGLIFDTNGGSESLGTKVISVRKASNTETFAVNQAGDVKANDLTCNNFFALRINQFASNLTAEYVAVTWGNSWGGQTMRADLGSSHANGWCYLWTTVSKPLILGYNSAEKLRVHSTGVSVTGTVTATTVTTGTINATGQLNVTAFGDIAITTGNNVAIDSASDSQLALNP